MRIVEFDTFAVCVCLTAPVTEQMLFGKNDEFVSKSGFVDLRKRVRSKAKRNHERKCRRLRVFKFDGKQSKNAVGKGRFKKKTNITVIQEPEPQYVDHFSCRDNGLNDVLLQVFLDLF